MFVQDLIEELQKLPSLASVFIDRGGGIARLGDTTEVLVKYPDGSPYGPVVEVESDADDFGILLL